MVNIEDNFLELDDFYRLQSAMIRNPHFPWGYVDYVDYKDKVDILDTFQFEHWFYGLPIGPMSSEFSLIEPCLEIFNDFAMWRVKANLLTKTPKIVPNDYHVDTDLKPHKLKQWTNSILYVNTNDGYTEFEDGTKVESIENRMITFPADMKHRGTSCTDKKIRVVINFLYFNR